MSRFGFQTFCTVYLKHKRVMVALNYSPGRAFVELYCKHRVFATKSGVSEMKKNIMKADSECEKDSILIGCR